MNTGTRKARRAAVTGLLAGLGLAVGEAAAQEPTTLPLMKLPAKVFQGAQAPPAASSPERIVTTPPLVEGVKPPDDGLGATAPKCDACDSKDAKDNKPADRFANVPPVQVFPRLGYAPVLPSGPGFYTIIDFLQGNEREGPPKHPHARSGAFPWSFFNVDWRYLDDPNNTEDDTFAFLKRQRFCDDTCMFTSGGELRARYNYEANARLQNTGRNAGRDNTYDLYRTRIYTDVYLTENYRFFAEFIAATSPNYLFTPAPVDRNWADMLNLFVDAKICCIDEKPVWLRVGRQELLYGSERLISPADWGDSRRTFQGARAFWYSEKDDFDLFCVQPVIPNYQKFDSVDNNVIFAGAWYTHRPKTGTFIDAYYLMLDDTNKTATGRNGAMGGRTVHTFGGRYVGQQGNWLWDFEGMLQCGEYVNQGLFANAFTAGAGYHFKDCAMTPTVWAYFDHASGTPNPGEGTLNQTFAQLFPFGHYYFGFIDIVGRRNINDVSAYMTFYPDKWLFAQVQCHNFWLDSAKDALYAANGMAIRQDKTGAAGNYVGTEFDFLFNFHIDAHQDLLLSYSYMFAGPFIIDTAKTNGGKQDPQALYCQYTYRW